MHSAAASPPHPSKDDRTGQSRPARIKLKPPGGSPAGSRLVYGALLVLLAYVCAIVATGASLSERVFYLRSWSVIALGAFAMSPPNLLLPDPRVGLFHHLNPPPWLLQRYVLRRWIPVLVLLVAPAFMLAYFDPGNFTRNLGTKTVHVLWSVLLMLGGGLYAFAQYMTIGKRSQAWQEGKRGKWYRWLARETPVSFVGVPQGLVPVFWATSHVLLVGMVFLGVSLWLIGEFGPAAAWASGFVYVTLATLRLLIQAEAFDAHFYRTNALYEEIFRSAGGVRVSDREPIPYRAVYWTPERWKPHVWAFLRQFDRRLPLGRFLFLGHAVLWILFYQDARAGLIAGYLLAFSAAKNATVFLTASEAMAPRAFQLLYQPPRDWTITRFFVNLRWTLPFFLSLLFVAIFTDRFNLLNVISWTLLDIVLAFASAWATTLTSESPYTKRYA